MKVLLCASDGILSDIMALALEGVLSADCLLVSSEEQARLILDREADLDLCVIESDLAESPALAAARRRRMPLIRISGPNGELKPSASEQEFVLVKPLDVRNFLELARVAVKGDPNVPRDEKFCRVRLDTLLLVGSSQEFEVFVRLSAAKFVRVLKRGDAFDGEKYAHFQAKGVTHLFVPKEDFVSYLSVVASSLHNMVQSESFTLETAVMASTQVYESFRDGMMTLGITPETQRVMKLTVDLALRSVEKNPTLRELFRGLSKNQDSFQAWHSVALAYVACKLCSLMTWDSQSTHYKLALAALLHDVTLPRPEWSEFRSLEEAKKHGLTESELAEYSYHPLRAADLARQLSDNPGDVDHIIAQHHERPDGSGYPNGVNHTKISPLSALFIVAHELCYRLYHEGISFDFQRFLSEFDQQFPYGYFRKIRVALEKIEAKELGE